MPYGGRGGGGSVASSSNNNNEIFKSIRTKFRNLLHVSLALKSDGDKTNRLLLPSRICVSVVLFRIRKNLSSCMYISQNKRLFLWHMYFKVHYSSFAANLACNRVWSWTMYSEAFLINWASYKMNICEWSKNAILLLNYLT